MDSIIFVITRIRYTYVLIDFREKSPIIEQEIILFFNMLKVFINNLQRMFKNYLTEYFISHILNYGLLLFSVTFVKNKRKVKV